jgi:hypothetical protein
MSQSQIISGIYGILQGVRKVQRMGPLLCAILLSFVPVAQAEQVGAVFGSHHGYVTDVIEEKNKRDIEMVMLEEPKRLTRPNKNLLVNERLEQEFQRQYQYRFGQTKAEQAINSPGRTDEYLYFTGRNVTVTEYRAEQRRFAEYMARRLTEFHVDNWAKTDPGFRTVYQLKDRVSNLDVQVRKGYKVKWKYNLAGPNMEVDIENPYDIETRVRLEMAGFISKPLESILTLSYQLTPRYRLQGLIRQVDGLYQLITIRQINPHLSTSFTASIDTRPEGPTIQQNLFLVGLSWSE